MSDACESSPPLPVSQEAVCTVKSEAPDPTITCKTEEPWATKETVEDKNTTLSTSGDRTKTSSDSSTFECNICHAILSAKHNLRRHISEVHERTSLGLLSLV
nr:unnamed protein product [Spirometra erinaceieuropaei]